MAGFRPSLCNQLLAASTISWLSDISYFHQMVFIPHTTTGF